MDLLAAIADHVLDLHRQIHQAVADELHALSGGGGSLGIALIAAFALGAVHALTPGHGKAVLLAHFLGRRARPWAGMAAAAQVATLHVGSAIILVAAMGAASSALGRSSGVAAALQIASAMAVTAVGCWYLWRALARGNPRPEARHHGHSSIALAVGLLPCPLTMLILSAAFARASLGAGLLLVLVMGFGIMATIGVVGSIGIAARRGIAAGFDGASWYVSLLRILEVASAVAILALGISALAAS